MTRVYLQVEERNDPALALYAGAGFETGDRYWSRTLEWSVRRLRRGRSGHSAGVTIVTEHTHRALLVRGAIVGAIVLNIPTLFWGRHAGTAALIVGIVVAAALGAALGALAAWMMAPNRWGRWWSAHRRRPRNDETLPPPADLTP